MVNIATRYLLVLAVTCWLIPHLADAKERPWFKYENAYFQAYSDASEKKSVSPPR